MLRCDEIVKEISGKSTKKRELWFLKVKSEKQKCKEKLKSQSFIYITFLKLVFPSFSQLHCMDNSKFSFRVSEPTSEIFGEKWIVESFKWKAKKNLKVKSEKQNWKKLLKNWKLKAKSLILKTASEKRKFYDFAFQFWLQWTFTFRLT